MLRSRALWVVWLSACAAPVIGTPISELSEEERAIVLSLSPAELPAAPADPTNAHADDPAAARFGQALFYDMRFSGPLLEGDNDGYEHSLGRRFETQKVACAGCHIAADHFVDTRSLHGEISLAAMWVLRRTPSLLDVAQNSLFMWDGRRDALYGQPFGAIESASEMNSGRLYTAEQLFRLYRADYEAIFGEMPPLDNAARFPQLDQTNAGCFQELASDPLVCQGKPGDGGAYDGMTMEDQHLVTEVMANFGKAIGAYERLLTCGPSRFDAWAHGDSSAMSEAEVRGLRIFIGRGRCVGCHSGPYFSDFAFHNVGVEPGTVATIFRDMFDRGAIDGMTALVADELNTRGPYSDGASPHLPTDVPTDMLGAFKTPMLRCRSEQPSFMHTGHMTSLEEVLEHFNDGGDRYGFEGTSELADESGMPIPLGLSDEELADLAAFLRALEGPGPDASLLGPPR